MIDYKELSKDELIELLEVMRRNCISFEEEKERVRGSLGNLRQELERMEELDVMISLARDCIDYLNDRIAEKE
jgi:hypothetical protein